MATGDGGVDGRLTAQVGWLGMSVGVQHGIHQMNRLNSPVGFGSIMTAPT